MKPGEVMYYNWNRMALLSRRTQTKAIQIEIEMRTALQNAFASNPGDEMTEMSWKIVEQVKTTLSPEVIKSVDIYMK